jgi:hypothetical protein
MSREILAAAGIAVSCPSSASDILPRHFLPSGSFLPVRKLIAGTLAPLCETGVEIANRRTISSNPTPPER